MGAERKSLDWARVAAAAAEDKKAADVRAFDVSEVLVITDVFVICTAQNPRQVAAIVDEVERRVRAAGAPSARREGERDGGWVLLDFIDLVVHVQLPEVRTMYDLERLWRDCPVVELDGGPRIALAQRR